MASSTFVTGTWALVAGLLGLAVGSFLNVVIYRVPAGLSVVSPPSACPKCGHEIRNRHNVPVLGWLVLRGRCHDCRAPISVRYPLVEAATGALFAAVTARLLLVDRAWLVPAFLYLLVISVIAVMVALDGNPLPASIGSASIAVVYASLLLAAAMTGDWWGLGRAAAATFGLAVVGLVVARASAATLQDARELAQLVAAPVAFVSWWTLGYAAAAALVLAAGWAALRRDAWSVAAVWCVALAAAAAVFVPVP
jgi:leader peptidase (prepilin peptidase) / N-methyltransferase